MNKYTVLYNPYSGNCHGEIYAHNLDIILKDCELDYVSMPTIKDFKKFLKNRKEIIICGGDGTINYFISHTIDIKYSNRIFYYSTGTGNDFHNDVGNKVEIPYEINKYLEKLPVVTVKGQEYATINGVGFGLDGWCCAEGNIEKQKTGKPINYAKIALRGLRGAFKPRNAHVCVDGKEFDFKKVWMASCMNGRYFGGGMKIAPNQDRLNMERKVSVVIVSGASRLKLLTLFPRIFKGTHIKNKAVTIIKGHNVDIYYDEPCALQIDGEVILGVKKYSVKSK